jgi:hypothetical protein
VKSIMNSESVLNVPNSACTFEASITSNENVETILNAFLLFKGKQLQKAKLQISRIQQLISHIKISYCVCGMVYLSIKFILSV